MSTEKGGFFRIFAKAWLLATCVACLPHSRRAKHTEPEAQTKELNHGWRGLHGLRILHRAALGRQLPQKPAKFSIRREQRKQRKDSVISVFSCAKQFAMSFPPGQWPDGTGESPVLPRSHEICGLKSRLGGWFAGGGIGAKGLDDFFKLRLKFGVVFVPAGEVGGHAARDFRLFCRSGTFRRRESRQG